MEPYDGERYVELVEQIQKWGEQVKQNESMMKQVFEKSHNLEMCKNMFEDWARHQRKIVFLCNELLQHSIEV